MKKTSLISGGLFLSAILLLCACPAMAASPGADFAWWMWPLWLFALCFVLGMVAVPAGVGGGVLFVPIVSGLFPFHLDFVRGAGLLVALSGALAAGPGLLRSGLADLRLALPLALVASATAIIGALIGLALPVAVVHTALGAAILCIVTVMWRSQRAEFPQVERPDAWSQALQIHGVFHDASRGSDIEWRVHRTPLGIAIFAFIGLLAGMFGLGAGWANVPALNLVMGVPLRLSAGTSGLILSIVDTSAAWVYINKGALLVIVAAPSVVGMMLGARIGARLLEVVDASVIRRLVIAILLFAGLRALGRGSGVWS